MQIKGMGNANRKTRQSPGEPGVIMTSYTDLRKITLAILLNPIAKGDKEDPSY